MLGDELRSARQAAGMTQERLAHDAGVDRTYISLLERGIRSPTVDVFIRLCQAMSVRPSAVLARIEADFVGRTRAPKART